MLFSRLIWCSLLTALLVGSVQFAVGHWRAMPIILAAEVFESHMPQAGHVHAHEQTFATNHVHDLADSAGPTTGKRMALTWVAYVLYSFSMALLMFAVMGWWIWKCGSRIGTARLALAVAAAGLLSMDIWPALGLPAELPGMDAASLGSRQAWWVLAAGSAALACVVLAGAALKNVATYWRWLAAATLLALPFAVGAPQPLGDSLTGLDAKSLAQLQALEHEFARVTRWTFLSFWTSIAIAGGLVFARWLRPVIPAAERPLDGSVAA